VHNEVNKFLVEAIKSLMEINLEASTFGAKFLLEISNQFMSPKENNQWCVFP